MIVLWGFPLPLPTRVQRVKKIEQFSYFSALVVQGVPSHKLLPLGYQIFARLAAERSPFQAVLRKVLARLAIEHPHHMLLHVLALTHLSNAHILVLEDQTAFTVASLDVPSVVYCNVVTPVDAPT